MSELTRLLKQAMGATDPARLVGCVIAANAALDAHNHEVELATARKVLEAAQAALTRETYVYAVGIITDAILALYPELAQPVEPGKERSDG